MPDTCPTNQRLMTIIGKVIERVFLAGWSQRSLVHGSSAGDDSPSEADVFGTGDPAMSTPLISALRIYSVFTGRYTDAPLCHSHYTSRIQGGRSQQGCQSLKGPPSPALPLLYPASLIEAPAISVRHYRGSSRGGTRPTPLRTIQRPRLHTTYHRH